MHERPTRLLSADEAGIAAAATILRAGGLVAFPTETVYGLGANAFDAEAVAGIFRAKSRPAEDPLIVHLPDAAHLGRVVRHLPGEARTLARAFWPGPLTLVLSRTPDLPHAVTAGLDTVGVRVPAQPVARALLGAAGLPIAAPSANLFARPSPTRAEHVLEDLRGRIDALLDGGPTALGVESTIIDLSGARPRLLRPGGVPAEAIEAALGRPLLPPPAPGEAAGPQKAPGLLDTHYAPRTPLVLITGSGDPSATRSRLRDEVCQAAASGQRVGVLLLEEDRDLVPAGVASEPVGTWGDPAASAARLFDALRALDRARLDVLYARDLADPVGGLGRALADRLRRAASRRIAAESR
jgi:L-threonylcarbamoyladenylate synthase